MQNEKKIFFETRCVNTYFNAEGYNQAANLPLKPHALFPRYFSSNRRQNFVRNSAIFLVKLSPRPLGQKKKDKETECTGWPLTRVTPKHISTKH